MAAPVLLFSQQAAPYPPLGSLVDVGGYRVHLYCTGAGSPTVIIAGGFSFDWALVQPQVAKFTKVCTYDVSGTAWSDPGPAFSCAERVNEVHSLLHHAALSGPYVFVGFSIGALVSRYYASQYPSEVAGMAIVDHAFTPQAIPPASPALSPTGDRPPRLISSTPIIFSTEETSDFSKLPERIQALHRWAAARTPALPTAETADDCLAQLRTSVPNPYPLRDIPLVVVSTANQARGYKELQTELLSLSHNSAQVIAEHSFHSVEIDQPDVVIAAIRQAVNQVRR
jgi:pimeloyl-ACP methyl ester carboxylesterase